MKRKRKLPVIICSIHGCGMKVTHGGLRGANGAAPLCSRHYHRARRGSRFAMVAELPDNLVRLSVSLDRELLKKVTRATRAAKVERGRVMTELLEGALRASWWCQ